MMSNKHMSDKSREDSHRHPGKYHFNLNLFVTLCTASYESPGNLFLVAAGLCFLHKSRPWKKERLKSFSRSKEWVCCVPWELSGLAVGVEVLKGTLNRRASHFVEMRMRLKAIPCWVKVCVLPRFMVIS